MDSRAGRVLEEDRRSIFDDEEWDWIVEHASGDFDHLLIATTVPYLLSPAFHHLEAWNERLGDGAWGSIVARGSEKLRRALDFDHWAAFQFSFDRLRRLLEEVGSGPGAARRPRSCSSPAMSITPISPRSRFDVRPEVRSAVFQAVCSPYRNPLDERERRVVRVGFSRPPHAVARPSLALPALLTPASAGARWRARTSTTRSARFASTGAAPLCDSTRPSAAKRTSGALEKTFERRLV